MRFIAHLFIFSSLLTATSAVPAVASGTEYVAAAKVPTHVAGAAATSAVLRKATELSEFNALLVTANLKHLLKRTTETYTVFAPTNAAVRQIRADIRKRMFVRGNRGLDELMRRHMVAGNINFDQLADGAELKTLSGEVLHVVKRADGSVLLNGVYRVTGPGQTTANGTVYSLESMIAPTR